MHKNNGGSTMPHRGFVLPLSKKLRDSATLLWAHLLCLARSTRCGGM